MSLYDIELYLVNQLIFIAFDFPYTIILFLFGLVLFNRLRLSIKEAENFDLAKLRRNWKQSILILHWLNKIEANRTRFEYHLITK